MELTGLNSALQKALALKEEENKQLREAMIANGYSPLKVPATFKMKKDNISKSIHVYQRFDRSEKMKNQAI
jgi:hypothetical protein